VANGKSTVGNVRSVERALLILEALAEQRAPASVSDVANRLKLHPATAHRLLTTLVGLGWLEQDEDTARYRLGPRPLAVGAVGLATSPLVQQAGAYLRRLAEASGFNSYLSVLSGRKVIHLARSLGRLEFGVPAEFEAGSRWHPTHSMAAGKVLLAHLPPEKRHEILPSEELSSLTPNTITRRSELEKELEQVRRQGYALDNGEWSEFIRGVAVPVIGAGGSVTASIQALGRADDLTPEIARRLAQDMTLLADELSQRIGAPAE
jgi:DNA-binding IclR family transcriptional regulator